jgi:hypothetical protein
LLCRYRSSDFEPGNDLDLNAVTATSVNALVVDTIAPTIAVTMSDTTLSTGETTAVTFTFSEALAVGKNIDNVLESVANALYVQIQQRNDYR